MERKGLIALGVTGVVIVGAGAFIARATLFPPKDKADQLLAEMKSTPEEQRGESMRRFREQADQMTEEERQKLREGMRAMFEEQIDERVNEYEEASDDQKVAVLDKHIDDFVARRADWEKRRAEWEADRARSGENAPGGGQAGASQGGGGAGGAGGREGDTARGGPEGRGPGGPRQPPTIEERKRRMEGTNPDSEVRRMRYFRAVRERAQKRGIEMGPGPGGRGGPGGGRGPGGRGGI